MGTDPIWVRTTLLVTEADGRPVQLKHGATEQSCLWQPRWRRRAPFLRCL